MSRLFTLSDDIKTITAKPTMEKPEYEYKGGDVRSFAFWDKKKAYDAHIASLPSYVAIGFDKSDVRRPLEEGKDFRLQHQMTTWKKEIWYDCEEEGYNNTVEDSRRIVAYKSSLPKEQGEESHPLKEFVVIADGDEVEMWTKWQYETYVQKALELGAAPAVGVVTTFNKTDRYLSTPSPEGKESVPITYDESWKKGMDKFSKEVLIEWAAKILSVKDWEISRLSKEVERLKGLLQEVCVRANITFPTEEHELKWFDQKFIGQHELMVSLNESLGWSKTDSA